MAPTRRSRWLIVAAWLALVPLMLLPLGWASLALAFCLPGPSSLRTVAAIALVAGFALVAWRGRSLRRLAVYAAGAFGIGLVVFFAQAASNDRPWSPDVAVLP